MTKSAHSSARPLPRERARILVVDDEPHARRILVRTLQRAGHEVMEATTGEDGLRLAREAQPDLVLLDVVLPDLDGLEVCRRIKDDTELAYTIVVLISGKQVDSNSQAEGLEGGADGYMLRGTPARELLARLQALLRVQRTEQALRESEAWLELAIAGSRGAMWHMELDPDDPTDTVPDKVYLAPRLKQFIGYTDSEFPNSIAAWESRVLADDLSRLRESSQRHRRGESELHDLEYRIRHRDGSIRWLHTCGRVERDRDGRPSRFAGIDWDVTERRSAEEALRAQARQLGERVKELDCLYGISHLVETSEGPLSDILQGVVELLPPAWQYPDIAAARIVLEDQEYRSAGFDATAPWSQSAEIAVRGQIKGMVQVCYLEPRPQSDEGAFAREERSLLNAVAERLGRIAERVGTQRELRESLQREQFLGDIIRNASITIGVGYPDGSLGMNNRAAQELTGYSREELKTLDWRTDLTPPEWHEHEAGKLRELERTKKEVRFEKEYVRKDGSRVPVELVVHPKLDESGNVEAYISFVTDITERRQRLEALRRERDLVARIMETSPVGIVVLDQQGRITFANAQVEQITGLTREQFMRLGYNDPTWRMVDGAGSSLADDLLPFPRVMDTRLPVYDLQQVVELPQAQGGVRQIYLSMNAAPFYDGVGEADGVVVSIEDVTAQTRLQAQIEQYAADLEQRVAKRTAELEASQAALLRAERLAIAGKLAASLTHEISNPLQSVIGCLGLAEETLAEGGDVDEYLLVALPELRRVARIVARLRNLGRPPSPRSSRQPTNVNDLLAQVRALTQKQCQDQGIELVLDLSQDLPAISVVPDQIQQVFLNLLLNAIESMPGGGQIEIRTSRTCDPRRDSGLVEEKVRISFKDSGIGISASALPHIFDPFYSTKLDGLGLGLSISQEIAEQHGGTIEVESEAGKGALFTVWLPA